MSAPSTLHHRHDPDTSVEAAFHAAANSERRLLVVAAIARRPMTGPQLDLVFPEWPKDTGRKRVSELKAEGVLIDTGERIVAPPATLAAAVVDIHPDFRPYVPDWPSNRMHPDDLIARETARLRDAEGRRWACPFKSCRDMKPSDIPTSEIGLGRHLSLVHGASPTRLT